MKKIIKIPRWLKYKLRYYKAELLCRYYEIMKQIKISDLKIGDKLYRVNHSDGRLLSYTIAKIDGSWFTLANGNEYICSTIQCTKTEDNNINGEFWTHPMLAIWMSIRKICDEQRKLEEKRLQIIKANKIKAEINTYPKKHWWNK